MTPCDSFVLFVSVTLTSLISSTSNCQYQRDNYPRSTCSAWELCRPAIVCCVCISVISAPALSTFCSLSHSPYLSLTHSFNFILLGILPCNCCSLHQRIAWLHSSHSYWLPVTGRGVNPTGHNTPPWSPVPIHAICVFSILRFIKNRIYKIKSLWVSGEDLSHHVSHAFIAVKWIFQWRVLGLAVYR